MKLPHKYTRLESIMVSLYLIVLIGYLIYEFHLSVYDGLTGMAMVMIGFAIGVWVRKLK